MNIRPVSEWTLYRLRFVITYGFLAALTLLLLVLYIQTVPPGLGPSEQQSVITSSAISFTQLPTSVVDLPYHVLQKLSVEWLGVTPFGVRLPSLVIGAFTALCMILLLRRWFKPHVAVLAGIIVVTSCWFLSVSRLGAPFIMVPFWTSLLLLSATYVSQQTKAWRWWRVAFAMSAALSFYTPFTAYLFITAALATFAQPHLRYLLREGNKVNLVIGGFFFLLLLVPLGWGIYKNPSVALELLAWPVSLPDPLTFGKNLIQAISSFLNPFNVGTTEFVTPMLSLVGVALLLLGGGRLLRDFHSVRAHVLLIWAAVLVPIVGLNPGNLTVVLVPAMLVMTIGLNQIIRYWYRLFPRNPYARLFGLLPLAFLIFSVVQLSYQRYMFGMLYSAQAATTFRQDAFLAQAELNKLPASTKVTMVVPNNDLPLYNIMAERRTGTVATTVGQLPDRQGTWLVAQSQDAVTWTSGLLKTPPSKLLVTDHKSDALRFRIYQR